MLNLLLRWVMFAVALIIVAWLVPGISIMGFTAALVGALVMGIVNLLIRPVLQLLTLPITVLTLGLFAFVLNALLLMFVAYLVPGFIVTGFLPALLGSILLSIISIFINRTTEFVQHA